MSFTWTQTNAALDEFLDILACEKCKRITETPVRSIVCGQLLCETCCTRNSSSCTDCNVPSRPEDTQPYHSMAQLINCCRMIRKTTGEIKEITMQDNRVLTETTLVKNQTKHCIESSTNKCIMKNSLEGNFGNTDSLRKPLCSISIEDGISNEIRVFRVCTQAALNRTNNDADTETPGYRDLTQTSSIENEIDYGTPGYRDPTQDRQRLNKCNLTEKSSLRALESYINTNILVPETVDEEKMSTDVNNKRKIVEIIPESMEIAEGTQDSVVNATVRNGCKVLKMPTTKMKHVVANKKMITSETSKTSGTTRIRKKEEKKGAEDMQRRKILKIRNSGKNDDISRIPKIVPKNVNKRNAKGESVLHTACVKGQSEYVKVLLEAGANPNIKDNAQWTPLVTLALSGAQSPHNVRATLREIYRSKQEAVTLGHEEICKMLLESGASPNTPGMENRTALHDAVINDKLELALLLLQHNAKRDVYDIRGKRPLEYAVSEEMRALLSENSNFQATEVVTETPCLNTTLDNSIPTSNAKVVVLPLDLSANNKKLLVQMASRLKIALATSFRSGVTHVVVEANERNVTQLSYGVMLAILEGKWILNSQWIAISTELNDISDIDLGIFQVDGAPNLTTPERARINEEKQNPRLFDNCSFYFTIGPRVTWRYGQLELTKRDLTNLVLAGQGETLNREPDPENIEDERLAPFHVAHDSLHPLHRCTRYIIYMPGKDEPRVKYNMPHIKTLPLGWFFECIEKFQLVDPVLMGIPCS